MADLSSLGSIFPVASVSKRLKAYLSSSISSSVRPGRSTFFFPPVLAGGAFLIVQFKLKNILTVYQTFNLEFRKHMKPMLEFIIIWKLLLG